jgi:hypothetical protein
MPKELSTPEVDGPQFGVFDSAKVYDQRAIARILGLTNYRWVIRNLFLKGLPCTRIGRLYLASGRSINRWVEENEQIWQPSDIKLSVEQIERTSSSVGSAPLRRRGGKNRCVELPDVVTRNG